MHALRRQLRPCVSIRQGRGSGFPSSVEGPSVTDGGCGAWTSRAALAARRSSHRASTPARLAADWPRVSRLHESDNNECLACRACKIPKAMRILPRILHLHESKSDECLAFRTWTCPKPMRVSHFARARFQGDESLAVRVFTRRHLLRGWSLQSGMGSLNFSGEGD